MNTIVMLASNTDWLNTAQQVLTLISGLVGVIGALIGAIFAIKNFIKANRTKNMSEIWSMVMSMADAAMKEAEQSSLKGEDKKAMVINSVKAACKSAGIDIDNFLDQLSTYIDQTIDFVNNMNK